MSTFEDKTSPEALKRAEEAWKQAAELPLELREKLFVDSLKAQRKGLKPRFAQKLEKIGRWGSEEVFLNAPESVRNDPDLAAIAVRRCPAVYRHLSDELKNNVAVILPAVQDWPDNFDEFVYINPALGDNKEVMMGVVQIQASLLEYANNQLKADKRVVMAAVKKSGRALRYADDTLKGDREIVTAAVQQAGEALQYASDALKGDKEVVLAAVQQAGEALQHASDALKGDKEIVTAALQQNLRAFQFIDNKLIDWVINNAFLN